VAGQLALAVLAQAATAREAAHRQVKALARIQPATPRARPLGLERAQALRGAARRSVASASAESDAQAVRFAVSQLESLSGRIAQIENQLESYYHEVTTPVAEKSHPTSPDVSNDPAPQTQSPAGGAPAHASCAPSEPNPPAAPGLPEQMRLVDSLPGVGACTIVLRTRGVGRFSSSKALAAQLGACPERDQTGSSRDRGHLTHRGDRRTRSTLFMLTRAATQRDPVMAFHKWRHLRQGLKPKQALCACMNRLTRWIHAVVHNRAAYDPARAIENARRHHGRLWEEFLQTQWQHAA